MELVKSIVVVIFSIFIGVWLGRKPAMMVVTENELRDHGPHASALWISLLGHVFDVSKAREFYGEDGGYNGFTGRDASRAFVTGDFTDAGLVSNLEGLTARQLVQLVNWLRNTYVKKYPQVAVLHGAFFDEVGQPTPYLTHIFELVKASETQAEAEARRYPTCSSTWSAVAGGRRWCEDSTRLPRQFVADLASGDSSIVCTCVRPDEEADAARLRLWPDCPADATECPIPPARA